MSYLIDYEILQNDDVHIEIMNDLDQRIYGGLDIDKSLRRVIPKYRSKFDSLFDYDEESIEKIKAEDDDEDDDEDNDDNDDVGGIPNTIY